VPEREKATTTAIVGRSQRSFRSKSAPASAGAVSAMPAPTERREPQPAATHSGGNVATAAATPMYAIFNLRGSTASGAGAVVPAAGAVVPADRRVSAGE